MSVRAVAAAGLAGAGLVSGAGPASAAGPPRPVQISRAQAARDAYAYGIPLMEFDRVSALDGTYKLAPITRQG